MICLLSGTIDYRGSGFVLLRTNDVGYRIFIPKEHCREFSGDVSMYVHEVIRDNEREFFGFKEMHDLELFWKLIGISGVGPKGAQKIVFSGGSDKVRNAIAGGDLKFFTAVSGIGKKTGQKIMLELSGILVKESTEHDLDSEALEALMGLGFPRKEAEKALSAVDAETTEERVRLVLKGLPS